MLLLDAFLILLFMSMHFSKIYVNSLITTHHQISHTTIYLAQKIKSIYTLPTRFRPEDIRSLYQAIPKVVYDLGLVDTNVER